MQSSNQKALNALRVFAVLLLLFSIAAFVMVLFTFIVSFFVGGQVLSDGSGIMRLLLRPRTHGRLAIDSALFAFAWLPGVGFVSAFLVYCSLLVHTLRKRKKMGPGFPGEKKLLAALCVCAALTLVLPLVLWPFSAPHVAQSGTFTQPMPTPVPGVILLVCTLLGVLLARRAAPAALQEGPEAEAAAAPATETEPEPENGGDAE